jgi:hypothetical protein
MIKSVVGCRLVLALILGAFPGSYQERPTQPGPDLEVGTILRAAADYCRRLENSALDFVCLEQITEKVNLSKDIVSRKKEFMRSKTIWTPSDAIFKNTYLYDFQYIRKSGQTRETRRLLTKNGRTVNRQVAELRTLNFLFQDVLVGPVGILSERSRADYDYRVSGEDRLDGAPVIILEVVPKPGVSRDHLYGKVWLDKERLDILKVEWSQKRIGNFQIFEERAKRYRAEPRITMVSSFGVEKNGLRFPSRFFIEEAYIGKNGKKFVHSETMVIYRDFKFFTVEVEVSR